LQQFPLWIFFSQQIPAGIVAFSSTHRSPTFVGVGMVLHMWLEQYFVRLPHALSEQHMPVYDFPLQQIRPVVVVFPLFTHPVVLAFFDVGAQHCPDVHAQSDAQVLQVSPLSQRPFPQLDSPIVAVILMELTPTSATPVFSITM
jgi:hypothetical protein